MCGGGGGGSAPPVMPGDARPGGKVLRGGWTGANVSSGWSICFSEVKAMCDFLIFLTLSNGLYE